MTLPPGVSEAAFGKALQAFANVVGPEWVFRKEEDVAAYNDAFSPFVAEPKLQRVASAAVAPTQVEQVQQIVRIANQYRIPLYAVSTGRNLGYGGSAPNLSGSVVVDLKRMNRILEVNTREGYMIVEPGVSFIELKRYFDEHEIDFVPSAPGPGWGSPIGNALDRGAGFPYSDNFSAVKGLEVVLANGEVLRTGRGGLQDPKLWPLYKYGLGPDLVGFFSQSNFGIVTKGCFWLEPKADLSQGFTISSPYDADLDPMIDALNYLSHQDVIHGFEMGSPLRSSTGSNDVRTEFGPPEAKELLRRRDGGTTAEWEALAKKVNIPLAGAAGKHAWTQAHRAGQARLRARLPEAQERAGDRTARHGDDWDLSHLHRVWRIDVEAQQRGALLLFADSREDPRGSVRDQRHHPQRHYRRRRFRVSGRVRVLRRRRRRPDGCVEGKAHDPVDGISGVQRRGQESRRRELFKKLVKACGQKGWAEYRVPVDLPG